ncbi:Yqey-like protein-domain-containing protein [Coprinopsis sp. MPI-PUGE-AT-0042]|nr:Yqey-like protein-domain-containing protein [Coprinopsis sp. MPI-PUGE-AT-0042]
MSASSLRNIAFRHLQVSCRRTLGIRMNSTAAQAPDLRKQIMDEIKVAMKNKDSATSTTLRSVLSEVYNADKASKEEKVNSSQIVTILRKSVERRTEAADKFTAASRSDLAEKELKEANIISKFLPPTLSEDKVDSILSSIIAELPSSDGPPQRALGLVFKQFYAQVDKSVVDSELLKKRAQALMTSRS